MAQENSVPSKWVFSSGRQVAVAIVLGVLLGGFFPEDQWPTVYQLFVFLSRAFVSLIKGLIMPLLFSTLVVGIAQTGDMRAVGRMGAKALLYFEVVTTIALFIGLFIANTLRPGDGLPINLGHEQQAVRPLQSGWEIAMHMFPSNPIKHAAESDILPVVVFAVIFGLALTRVMSMPKPKEAALGRQVLAFFEGIAQVMFQYTELVMKLTPFGVLGAMASNVSHMASGAGLEGGLRGWPAVFMLLGKYAKLVGSLYLALFLLFLLVFVPVLLLVRVKPLAFLRAIKDPAITAYTTASSEAALPTLLERVVAFGVPRRVASFVIPAGYSFNLDGSTLYLVLASLTIAQAAHIEMPLGNQLVMVFTFMLTSKGVAGVPRGTLVIISATCGSFGLPGEAGIAMLLAVDALMDMGRTLINVLGNAIASIVVARWEGVFGEEDDIPTGAS